MSAKSDSPSLLLCNRRHRTLLRSLAWDDRLREELGRSPREVLERFGLRVDDRLVPVTLPKKEALDQVLTAGPSLRPWASALTFEGVPMGETPELSPKPSRSQDLARILRQAVVSTSRQVRRLGWTWAIPQRIASARSLA